MKLSDVKRILQNIQNVEFVLENGVKVPEHFHVTEVGKITKHFIDCGGVMRTENKVNFQLWNANDTDHRLKPQKLFNIIKLSEDKLGLTDEEIEVEYQAETIGKFGLDFMNNKFILTSKYTNCLASDACGIPQEKLPKNKNNSCTPGGGCC